MTPPPHSRVLGYLGSPHMDTSSEPNRSAADAATAILSLREREVAELVATRHLNDEIAQALHISLRTSEKHVSSALNKLQLRSRVQLGRLLARS